MAKNWLRRLKLTSVDVVPRGANGRSMLRLAKADGSHRDLEEMLRSEMERFAPGEKDYLWIADFSHDWVVYQINDGPYLQRSYMQTNDGVTFGEPVEVIRQTRFVEKEDEAGWVAKENPSADTPTVTAQSPEPSEETQMPEAETPAEPETPEEEEAETPDPETPEEAPEAEAELATAKQRIAELEAEVAKEERDLSKELDETKDKLAEIEKERRTERFIAKAKEFSEVGSPERIGKLLEEADENFDEETQKTLAELLKGAKAAAKQAEEAGLFKQLSDPQQETEDWEVRLDKAADELMASDSSLTKEQAKVKAMQQNPEIRKEYALAKENA